MTDHLCILKSGERLIVTTWPDNDQGELEIVMRPGWLAGELRDKPDEWISIEEISELQEIPPPSWRDDALRWSGEFDSQIMTLWNIYDLHPEYRELLNWVGDLLFRLLDKEYQFETFVRPMIEGQWLDDIESEFTQAFKRLRGSVKEELRVKAMDPIEEKPCGCLPDEGCGACDR